LQASYRKFPLSAALMPNVNGKILVCKQWGAGYQNSVVIAQ